MSKETDDKLSERLELLKTQLLPSDAISTYRQYESSASAVFNGPDYGGFTDIFEMCFTVLTEQLNTISFIAQQDWSDSRTVQFITMAHNVKPFYSAFDRVSHGFPDDAVILIRPLFETIIRVVYMSCYPQDPYAALVHKPPSGIRQFQLTNFVEKDLGLDWLSEYGIVSSFTHSNSHTILEYAVTYSETGIAPLNIVRPQGTLDYTQIVTNSITFYLYCYMQIVRRVFSVELQEKSHIELWQAAQELEDILKQILIEHPNPGGRFAKLVQDADHLVELIVQSDTKSNWQDLWQQLRAIE